MLDEVIRRADLHRYCGLRRSQVDVYIALGTFPKPIRVGDRAVAWLASELEAWQAQRIAARDGDVERQEATAS